MSPTAGTRSSTRSKAPAQKHKAPPAPAVPKSKAGNEVRKGSRRVAVQDKEEEDSEVSDEEDDEDSPDSSDSSDAPPPAEKAKDKSKGGN